MERFEDSWRGDVCGGLRQVLVWGNEKWVMARVVVGLRG